MLNDAVIKYLAETYQLIQPFSFDSLQGHSYDCRLANEIQVPKVSKKGKAVIKRWVPAGLDDGDGFFLEPGRFVLGATEERFKLGPSFVGFISPKSGVTRTGLQLGSSGFIAAEFEGTLTLQLQNISPWPIQLRKGYSICQVSFFKVDEAKLCKYSSSGHYLGQQGPTLAQGFQ